MLWTESQTFADTVDVRTNVEAIDERSSAGWRNETFTIRNSLLPFTASTIQARDARKERD